MRAAIYEHLLFRVDKQVVFRKGRETRDQVANIRWIIDKAREFQRNVYFCFIEYTKAFDYVDHNKLQKIIQEMETLDHITCLLRNLYAGQEATVRTGHGKTDCFELEKGVYSKAAYCHPVYLTSMQSTSWEMLGWTKIMKRNINNFRYANDSTLMQEVKRN